MKHNKQHLMQAFQNLHSAYQSDPKLQRTTQSLLGFLLTPVRDVTYRHLKVGEVPCMWVKSKRPSAGHGVVLYCHGGGYTTGNLAYSRILAAKLARVAGMDVLAFEYPLAPEHPFPTQLNAAHQVYDYLLGQGHNNIAIVGESAGANLALALTARLRANGLPMPAALVCMSPWTDLTMSGESYRTKREEDPMLTWEYIDSIRHHFAPQLDFTNPYLSPLFADLSGFPPVLIQVGSCEILLDDARGLHQRLQETGVESRLTVWEDMWHVFQMFPYSLVPSAKAAILEAGRFLLEWTGEDWPSAAESAEA